VKLIEEKKGLVVQENNMEDFLTNEIIKAYKEQYKDDISGTNIVFPSKFGSDFMSPIAFAVADSIFGTNTSINERRERVANELISKIIQSKEFIESGITVEQKNGYINFFFSKKFLVESVGKIDEKFGTSDSLSGKKIMVEYTDPNPFKDLHIGHLMTNTVGESLARLFIASGAETKKVCYQGDVGMHVAKAVWWFSKHGVAQMEKGGGTLLDTEAIISGEAYVAGNAAYETDEEAKKEILEVNKRIYNIDPLKTYPKYSVEDIYIRERKESLEYFDYMYEKLNTTFDHYFFESETAEIGKKKVEEGLTRGIFEVGERGAVVYPESRSGIHTRVFINSEGLPTYEAKELGLAFAKRERVPVRQHAWSPAHEYISYDFDKTISVTGNEINDYFRVVLSALREIDEELASKVKHISHGMLRLPSGKMSSRTGDIVTAKSLIEEVKTKILEKMGDRDIEKKDLIARIIAIGAIKFSILRQAPGKDIIFDFDKSLSFEGDSGPYLQYTVVRARSVLEKATAAGIKAATKGGESEVGEVERMLMRFPKIVERAREEYSPQHIVTYLLELASLFNSYYAENRIVDAGGSAPYRVALTKAVAITIENGLNLLGIKVPAKM
jgi:arginyl-tRNA synthetase